MPDLLETPSRNENKKTNFFLNNIIISSNWILDAYALEYVKSRLLYTRTSIHVSKDNLF